MIRVKRQFSGSYTITETATDDDGNVLSPVAPFTVKVYDGANNLLSSHTPTCTAGLFSHTFTLAQLPQLDTYSIVWQGVVNGVTTQWTTVVELVGDFIFEIAELRNLDRAFKDTTRYPTATLRKIRTAVEETLESVTAANVAFVPRHTRVKLDGSSPDLTRAYNPLTFGGDYRGLRVPNFQVREIYSLSVNGTALTTEEIDTVGVDDNMLWRSAGVSYPAWPYGHRNIEIHYEHGMDRAPNAITRAGLILAKEYLITSDLPTRATATSIGDQMFRLTIAGRDGVTGIPDVDAAIKQFGRQAFGIG